VVRIAWRDRTDEHVSKVCEDSFHSMASDSRFAVGHVAFHLLNVDLANCLLFGTPVHVEVHDAAGVCIR
jgi:hypothetical protein